MKTAADSGDIVLTNKTVLMQTNKMKPKYQELK